MSGQRIVLVPGVPALLPQYASLVDPIPGLRAACRESLNWLAEADVPISVHCARGSWPLAEHLIAEAGAVNDHRMQPAKDDLSAVLVIGNGSACRTEKAPGFLDPRAAAFDAALGTALRRPDPAALADVDLALAEELLADTESIRWLGAHDVLTPAHRAEVRYDDAPYGVQYWVIRWELSDA
jgi:hypothetical protein